MTERNSTTPARQRETGAIRVGIGGWTYPAWRGEFYPAGLPQREELAHASRQLGMIEINGTYYRSVDAATYAGWRAATPDGFVFSVKAPRFATQRKRLADAGEAVERFLGGGVTELQDRLGPILWQLPAAHTFEDPADMRAFLELLPKTQDGIALRHVIEVRHATFRHADWLALARRYAVATVFTDSADFPSFADTTTDFVYARLMKASPRRKAGYTPRALDGWARACRTWARGGVPGELPRVESSAAPSHAPRDVYVLFINGFKPRAPAAALALQDRLHR